MVTDTKQSAVNSAFLFAQLNAKLKGQPDMTKRVLAHIKAVTGQDSLAAMLNGTLAEDKRLEVLSTCLRAIITRDYSKLKAEPVIEIMAEQSQTVNTPSPAPQEKPAAPLVTKKPEAPLPSSAVDPRLAPVMDALHKALAVPQQMDEAKMRLIVEQCVSELIQKSMGEHFKEAKYELLRAIDEHFRKEMKRFAENVAGFVTE